jgi:membrane-bound serine protease (ClpP class)
MESEWIVVLCIVGIICIASEVYLPGGFMGIGGGIAVLVAVVAAFNHNSSFGTMILVSGIGGSVSCSWFSFKYISKTKEGRKALLMDVSMKLPEDLHSGLENKRGVALTDLRPTGIISIDNDRVDAMTQGEYLEKGTELIVFKIEADRIYVREYKEKQNINKDTNS